MCLISSSSRLNRVFPQLPREVHLHTLKDLSIANNRVLSLIEQLVPHLREQSLQHYSRFTPDEVFLKCAINEMLFNAGSKIVLNRG